MVEILYFLFGMLTGAGMFMGYGYYQFTKIRAAKENLLDQLQKKAAEVDRKRDTIKERFLQATELAKLQNDLRAQCEMPSKNALHSRHKNDLIHEINDMEQRKLDLLRTILAEGYDPTITVSNENGSKREIPLSAYVNEALAQLNSRSGMVPPKDTPPGEAKKIGKFMIYKGGKDDGGTTH